MLVNLLAVPCNLLERTSPDAAPTILTIPPSGTIATARPKLDGPLWSSFATDAAVTAWTGYIEVRIPRARGTTFEGIPTEPGDYIIPAQVADALRVSGEDLRSGVTLYSPELLIYPGKPGHPGGDQPVAPGLLLRYNGCWHG